MAYSMLAAVVAITGATVFPVGAPRIDGGTVLIRDGRIAAVGRDVPIPAGAQRVDARGKIVTPGLINVNTQIGLVEVGGEAATRNDRARSVYAADFRPWDGFFSDSAYIRTTRADGVTTVGIVPSGSFIAGQTAAMHLIEGLGSQMLLRGPAAVAVSLRSGRFDGANDVDENTAGETAAGYDAAQTPVSRGEAIATLRGLLHEARWYGKHRGAYDAGRSRGLAAPAEALDALAPVVAGTLPLLVRADRADDIDAVIRLARDEHVRAIVNGGAEAWRLAGALATAHIPVVTGAMNNIPGSFETLASRQENVAILRRAGVEVAITGNAGGGDETLLNARNVRFEAGNAVAYGASREDALRAVTLAAANVLGIGDRTGSLVRGKLADVVVWSGDPFEPATSAEHVFVGGREYLAPSREDELTARYRSPN